MCKYKELLIIYFKNISQIPICNVNLNNVTNIITFQFETTSVTISFKKHEHISFKSTNNVY